MSSGNLKVFPPPKGSRWRFGKIKIDSIDFFTLPQRERDFSAVVPSRDKIVKLISGSRTRANERKEMKSILPPFFPLAVNLQHK